MNNLSDPIDDLICEILDRSDEDPIDIIDQWIKGESNDDNEL